MTTKELKRRISDALLAGGIDKDAGLAALLESDADARRYAEELQRLNGLLTAWPLPDRGDEGWEALATRIEQRVKDRVTAPGDLTLPPRFDDDDPFVREPSTFSPPKPGAARPAVIAKPASPITIAKPGAPAAAKPVTSAAAKPIQPASPAAASPVAASPVAASPVVAKPAAPVTAAAAPATAAPVTVAADAAVATASTTDASVAATAPDEPSEDAFDSKRITTEIAVADLEKVSIPPGPPAVPPSPPTRAVQATEEIAVSDLQKASTPPKPAEPPPPDFSLANLGALEVKHAAPPPVPKTPPKPASRQRAPEPKDDRATIPPIHQPLQAIAPLPDFAAAPLVVAPLKKSRGPLWGSLAAAATVVVAAGGWFTFYSSGSHEMVPASASVERSEDEAGGASQASTELAVGAASPPAVAPVVATPAPVPADQAPGALATAEANGDRQRADPEGAPTTPMMAGAPATITAAADGTLAHEENDAVTRGAGGGGSPPPPPPPAHAAHAHGGDGAAPTGAETHAGSPAPTEQTGGGHVAAQGAPGTGTGTTTHHAHTASDAPPAAHGDNPARDDVVRAMGTVHSAVQTCAVGRGGVAWVQVTFNGGTGRVSSALVQGQFAGTPQGSCIARAVRGAQVAPFSNPTFSVAYPFQL